VFEVNILHFFLILLGMILGVATLIRILDGFFEMGKRRLKITQIKAEIDLELAKNSQVYQDEIEDENDNQDNPQGC
jgi:hypothetical protein